MKKTLILGGTRFIGYHLLQALHEDGHNVTIFNRGITRHPGPLPPEIRCLRGDRDNPRDIEHLFRNEFDVVFDLSGFTPAQIQPISQDHRTNIGHYIFCSTPSVHKVPPPCPFNEESPRSFTANTYGGDKALAEDLLLTKHAQSGWPVTIVRPQGVFGPYDAHHAGFVFHRLLNSLPIPLRLGCDSRVNFLYVYDLVRAMLSIMDNAASRGRVYCVAGDDVTSQSGFIELCAQVCSKKPVLCSVDSAAYAELKLSAPWLDHDLVADNSRIRKEMALDFTPLEAALGQTFSWLVCHPQHTGRYRVRAERYVLRNYPVPRYVKIFWRVVDAKARLVNRLKRQRWLRHGRLRNLILFLRRLGRNVRLILGVGITT